MVNGDVSDLFFNHDIDHCRLTGEDGKFAGFDEAKMNEEAGLFLASLDRLGVAVPTTEELIADFHRRI